MGRFVRNVVLVTLVTGGASASGAASGPSDTIAGAPAEPVTRPNDPPASPRKYLETGATLFNKGRYELAGRYLQAAQMYRDRLTASEKIVLDVYREKLAAYLTGIEGPRNPAAPSTPSATGLVAGTIDNKVVPASTFVNPTPTADPVAALIREEPEPASISLDAKIDPTPANPAPDGPLPRSPRDTAAIPAAGTETWRDTADTKQKARWLMQVAREQIFKGHLDVAAQAIEEARGLNVNWTVFDETPDRMAEALEKARVRAGQKGGPAQPRDRKAARARLREARGAIAAHNLDQADAIVREVRSWGLSFGFLDDTPERVSSAVSEARLRGATRYDEMKVKSYVPVSPD